MVDVMAQVGIVAAALLSVLSLAAALSRTAWGRKLGRWIRSGHEQDRRQAIADVIDEVLPRHLSAIHKQLIPNGGHSMRDEMRNGLAHLGRRLDRTDRDVGELQRQLAEERELNARGRRGEIDRRRHR